MNKIFALASTLALVTAASQALADGQQRWPLWYVGLGGGLDFLKDSEIKGTDRGKLDYKDGGVFTGSLGYLPPFTSPVLNNLRVEAEFGYRQNSIDSLRTNAAGLLNSKDDVNVFSYMGNLYYDFSNSSQWTPYIGGGAGDATVHLGRMSGLDNKDSSANTFAYQFMGGISYAPTTLPMTVWSLGYRYFDASNAEYALVNDGRDKLDDYRSQSVELSARFRF